MTAYKLVKYNNENVSVTKFNNGVFECSIPFDEANTDYIEYKKWLSEGNIPDEPDTNESL